MAKKSSGPKVPAVPDDESADFQKHHEQMTRFPTDDQLRAMDAKWGINRSLDPTEFLLRFDRHIAHLAGAGPPELTAAWTRISIFLQPWFLKLLRALFRRRVNHQTLDATARDRFNQALQAAHADNSYQDMATIHSQDHMMHSFMGPLGTQRFLPWHREYLFKLEELLRLKQPAVTIPYWDYANDHARPDWVWKPPGVVRNTPGAAGGGLPTQSTIDTILLNTSYTSFTSSLESQAHNQVHNWCNGTISSPPTASQDPIFWLLHANVDRVWDMWEQNHTGVPALAGNDAVMDPWQPTTAADVNDVINVGYSYG
jgi:tyrosinase